MSALAPLPKSKPPPTYPKASPHCPAIVYERRMLESQQPTAPWTTLVTIKARADFLRIRGGAKWNTPGFLIETKPARTPTGPPRFGFTVTKKLGNAVMRNRIRRRLKEAVRLGQVTLAHAGYDYVIVGRPPAFDMAFERLVADVETGLRRVHAPPKPRPVKA
jgi:ribonuclease P protein component